MTVGRSGGQSSARWLALLVILCTANALAQSDLRGSSDIAVLQRFPESWITEYQQPASVSYLLALGTMRREGGRVVPENSIRTRGTLTRITYEVPQTYTGADVFSFFEKQIDARAYKRLFSCTGRDCGTSEYWANDVFDIRTLYGPERNQYYLAAEIGDPGNERYLCVYIITRANRRIYAHVEYLEADRSDLTGDRGSVNQDLLILREEGSLRLQQLRFDAEDRLVGEAGLGEVLPLLQANPQLRFYLVATLRRNGTLEELLAHSLNRATAVRDALVELGVDGARLEPQGVGPLAPRCVEGDCDERVELVLQP